MADVSVPRRAKLQPKPANYVCALGLMYEHTKGESASNWYLNHIMS